MKDFIEKLGKPNIQIRGLKIWVHGFQFPNAKEPFDRDWLNVTVHCSEKSASVLVSGNIICCSEIQSWSEQVALIYKNLKGKASLSCIESELDVVIESTTPGKFEMVVNITPDHLCQSHMFSFELDQSYLPELILSCNNVLKQFPVNNVV
jgi:hypothetical protein